MREAKYGEIRVWSELEKRINENERDGLLDLRQKFNEIIVNSALRPGQAMTKKMVSLEFGSADLLLWEIHAPATNFYVNKSWQERLKVAGFTV